jgi:phage tail-like protein
MRRPRIDALLPENYRRAADAGSPLSAVLAVMEDLHEPDEAILAHVETTFDPYRCADRFVPYLARWVDLDWLLPPDLPPDRPVPFGPGYGRLRTLVAHGAELAQWRGTGAGLRWFLTLATGVGGYQVDEVGHGRPFHLDVTVPAAAADHLELVRRIVAHEKPAYVTADVRLAGPPPEPSEPTDATDAPDPVAAADPGVAAPADPEPVSETPDDRSSSRRPPTGASGD